MRPWIISLATLCLLGCGEPKTAQDRSEADAQQAAEQQLMSDHSTAVPELEKRVAEWITFDKGFIVIVEYTGEPSFSMNLMPASTPWHVSCNSAEMELTIGNFDAGTGRNARSFTRALSFARFTEGQCKLLSAAVSRKMMEITAGASSQ